MAGPDCGDGRRSARHRIVAAAARVAAPALVFATLGATAAGPPHTELKESDPAADTVLRASPARVELTYTTDVQLVLSSVTVRRAGADGTVVAAGKAAHPAPDRRDVIVLPLAEPLPPGDYVVAWTTAGPDGHPLSGEFAFRVETPDAEAGADRMEAVPREDDAGGAPAGGDAQAGGGGFDGLPTMVRFLFYAAIAGLLGAVVFRYLVLSQFVRAGASPEVVEAAVARASRIAVSSMALLLLTVPLRIWYQAKSHFPDDVAGNLFNVATGTVWGVGWWLQLGVVLLAGAGWFLTRSGWRLVAASALLLPVVPVLSGHGWTDGPRALSAAATYLHVMAAGGWVGGLSSLLFAGLPALREHGSAEPVTRPGLESMVGAFSRVAQVAVALLLLTGAVKVWIHVGSLSDLWTTAWGRSLLVKDGVVAGVLALGFYNWRFVRPALEDGPRFGLIRGPAMIELLLGVGAVAVTAYLVAQPLS